MRAGLIATDVPAFGWWLERGLTILLATTRVRVEVGDGVGVGVRLRVRVWS